MIEKNEGLRYCEYIRNELREYYTGEHEDDDGETLGLYDYINKEVLDTEYIFDSMFNLIGVKLYVTLNGPTCWIDTREQTVVYSYGGSGKAFCYIDGDIAEEINAIYEETVSIMK